MRFQFAAVLAALAASVAADRLEVLTLCTSDSSQCTSPYGVFYTDFGSYDVDANDGCRGTGVPGMVDFCMDWGNLRGHFRFDHQPFKRCLRMTSRTPREHCSPVLALLCDRSYWDEVACSWREEEGPVTANAIVSASVAETGTSETKMPLPLYTTTTWVA